MWNFFINYNLIIVFWYYHHSWKDNYLQRHVQAPTLFPFVRPNSLGCCPISKSSELGTLGYKSGRKYRGQGYWVMRTEGEKIWCSGKKISPGVRQTLVSYFLHLPHPSLNFLICRMVIIKSLSYTRSGVWSCWPGHRMYKCRCFHPSVLHAPSLWWSFPDSISLSLLSPPPRLLSPSRSGIISCSLFIFSNQFSSW